MFNPNFVAQCRIFVRRNAETKSTLVTYLRKKKNNQPYAVVVAVKDGDEVTFGVSQCKLKEDNFNKYVGTYIATQRALARKPVDMTGTEVRKALDAMENRARKYWTDSPSKKSMEKALAYS